MTFKSNKELQHTLAELEKQPDHEYHKIPPAERNHVLEMNYHDFASNIIKDVVPKNSKTPVTDFQHNLMKIEQDSDHEWNTIPRHIREIHVKMAYDDLTKKLLSSAKTSAKKSKSRSKRSSSSRKDEGDKPDEPGHESDRTQEDSDESDSQ